MRKEFYDKGQNARNWYGAVDRFNEYCLKNHHRFHAKYSVDEGMSNVMDKAIGVYHHLPFEELQRPLYELVRELYDYRMRYVKEIKNQEKIEQQTRRSAVVDGNGVSFNEETDYDKVQIMKFKEWAGNIGVENAEIESMEINNNSENNDGEDMCEAMDEDLRDLDPPDIMTPRELLVDYHKTLFGKYLGGQDDNGFIKDNVDSYLHGLTRLRRGIRIKNQ